MGTCKYCGQKAGFLRSKHKECHEKALKEEDIRKRKEYEDLQAKKKIEEERKNKIKELSYETILKDDINKMDELKSIVLETDKTLLYEIVNSSISTICDDHIVSRKEEESLDKFMDGLELTWENVTPENRQAHSTYRLLRTIINKEELPKEIIEARNDKLVNYEKDEFPILIINGASLAEETSKTVYIGKSTGISVRVVKGVWIRQSAFKGTPIKTTEIKIKDKGKFIITTKGVYFVGTSKTFKKKYNQILNVSNVSDGVLQLSFTAVSQKIKYIGIGENKYVVMICNCINILSEI